MIPFLFGDVCDREWLCRASDGIDGSANIINAANDRGVERSSCCRPTKK
jgi:hypothetical protein